MPKECAATLLSANTAAETRRRSRLVCAGKYWRGTGTVAGHRVADEVAGSGRRESQTLSHGTRGQGMAHRATPTSIPVAVAIKAAIRSRALTRYCRTATFFNVRAC